MKTALFLKSLPALAMAFYAASRVMPMMKAKQESRQTAPAIPQEILGTVVDSMKDRHYHFVRIESQNGFYWVGTRDGTVAVGESVRCNPSSVKEAYESPELRMVLDRVFLADVLHPLV